MFVSKLIKFKGNLHFLFRERLKIQKGSKLFSITRSAAHEMIHLNCIQMKSFNLITTSRKCIKITG